MRFFSVYFLLTLVNLLFVAYELIHTCSVTSATHTLANFVIFAALYVVALVLHCRAAFLVLETHFPQDMQK